MGRFNFYIRRIDLFALDVLLTVVLLDEVLLSGPRLVEYVVLCGLVWLVWTFAFDRQEN